jgi:hypothetical protein
MNSESVNEISVVFQSVKNRDELAQWIMRQWFNAEKHGEKPWYSPSVNAGTVLSYVSRSKFFPLSPLQLTDMWRVMPTIRSGLKLMSSKDLKNLEEVLESEEKKVKNKSGEHTLNEIAKEVGDTSAPSIQQLERSGMMKFALASNGRNISDLEPDEATELNNKIDSARLVAAKNFVSTLREAESIDEFFARLIQMQTMTAIDLKITTQREKDTLNLLTSYDDETIIQFLLNDISRDRNVIKSYQGCVAHTVFPRRRGRPANED